MENLFPKLEDLTSEITVKRVDETPQVNDRIQELVNKKVRCERFKSRLTEDSDLPLKD